jgi:hypothetical protein
MTLRCTAQALTPLLLSSVAVAAHADDLWFQPGTPSASDDLPVGGLPAGGLLESAAAPASQPAVAIVLDAPLPARATPSPSVQAGSPPEQTTSPPDAQRPVRLPRLTVDVGAGVTMPNSDNPPAGLSVNMLGGDPSKPLPVTLAGQLPYGTQADVRTPEHQLGLHASYILTPNPTAGAPQVSIGASFGVNTYDQTETAREGVATLRINF